MTERFNQTLMNAIRKHSISPASDWIRWLPFVLLAYRSRIHSSTNYSPYEYISRKMNTFRDWKAKTNDELELFCRSVELRKLYDYTDAKAKEFTSKQQIQQKKTQDNNLKHIIDDIVPKGTFVAIATQGLKGKLTAKYTGPFTIDSQAKNTNYWLRNDKGVLLTLGLRFGVILTPFFFDYIQLSP